MATQTYRYVTLLTDFGLQDDFVGVCHGVIAKIAPDARVIDVTHGIPPQAVLQGAVVLANALAYLPEGVHVAVVDPGVGGERRAIAIRTRDGRVLVGPDNGLLAVAADAAGIEDVRELANPAYRLDSVSRTFHARDVFAPAAAHVAAGVDFDDLGPALEPAALVRISVPEPEVGSATLGARVLAIDRFGNVQLNLRREHMHAVSFEPGDRVELRLPLERYYALVAQTFADAPDGELILYEDAYGAISIAISGGNAARLMGTRPGAEIRIAPAPE